MENKNQNVLSGRDNNRLDKSTPIQKEGTAAWSNTKKTAEESNVSIPSGTNVVNAKDWVDDGSKL